MINELTLEELSSIISSVLRKNTRSNEIWLADLSRSVAAELLGKDWTTLKEVCHKSYPDLYHTRVTTYLLACAHACHWELAVRSLADVLKIQVFADSSFPKGKSPEGRPIDSIINDIKCRIPALDLNLKNINNLRNALVHCNFHQLKTLISLAKRREDRAVYDSGVVGGSFDTDEFTALDEVRDLEQIKSIGIFGWLLQGAGSPLFEDALELVGLNATGLEALIGLKGLSYKETAHVFDHIATKVEPLTAEEIELFKKLRGNQLKGAGDLIETVLRIFPQRA